VSVLTAQLTLLPIPTPQPAPPLTGVTLLEPMLENATRVPALLLPLLPHVLSPKLARPISLAPKNFALPTVTADLCSAMVPLQAQAASLAPMTLHVTVTATTVELMELAQLLSHALPQLN
jgi:hypothetical protein